MRENTFQELENLPGLPFTKATRLGQVQFFHFGRAHVTNAQGLILDVGAWTLEVACFWQLEKAGKVAIAYQDAAIARDAQALANPDFDPLVPGSNLRDRKLQELVRQGETHVKVSKVTASPAGEVLISLGADLVLRVAPSQGIQKETTYFWRLFSNTGTNQTLAFGLDGAQPS
ncbi:hypothetical protein [Rufibacter sp. LB8]|uniref:hypothetical protein n=1 Tax=Rufibacter sp. LB8 TaxID=2777781 RepID=UPI00178C6E93|nr:hypothetical protein [Rufibacter sp. LB8]